MPHACNARAPSLVFGRHRASSAQTVPAQLTDRASSVPAQLVCSAALPASSKCMGGGGREGGSERERVRALRARAVKGSCAQYPRHTGRPSADCSTAYSGVSSVSHKCTDSRSVSSVSERCTDCVLLRPTMAHGGSTAEEALRQSPAKQRLLPLALRGLDGPGRRCSRGRCGTSAEIYQSARA